MTAHATEETALVWIPQSDALKTNANLRDLGVTAFTHEATTELPMRHRFFIEVDGGRIEIYPGTKLWRDGGFLRVKLDTFFDYTLSIG